MARVVSIAEDLMLASRVDAMLTAAGHQVVLASSLQEASLDGGGAISPRCSAAPGTRAVPHPCGRARP